MKRIGILCLPGRGHLYPATALGCELQNRGHRVTVFSGLLARAIVINSGLRFGHLTASHSKPSPLLEAACAVNNGVGTLVVMSDHAKAVLNSACDAVPKEEIEVLLIDQADLAGGSVAEVLGIPFITLCFFPPIHTDPLIPPFICGWIPSDRAFARARISAANVYFQGLCASILDSINGHRSKWNLKELEGLNDCFSRRAIITQMPRNLEFQGLKIPDQIHYTGPFGSLGERRHDVAFPWNRLTGSPLVYASMGTVRNQCLSTFAIIAEALAGTNCQLVLSLGGTSVLPEDIPLLAGDPIVVHYAPQAALIERSVITIFHGGLNTCLESIQRGVPMIAIPIVDDQPGVAARIRAHGIGLVIPHRKVTKERLKKAVQILLENPKYKQAANQMRNEVAKCDGLGTAADIIESTLDLRSRR
jgi:zeaxanthin glucosyltransferase